MFELLEQTADFGFRARSRTRPELFETAAQALVSIALETTNIRPREAYPLAAQGEDDEALLGNWLGAVLLLLEGSGLALGRFRVIALEPGRVVGHALGEPRDAERHPAKTTVSGIARLEIVRDQNGWCAEVHLER